MKPQRRREVAWAFYDWGNSAFATTVMAGFFPAFFKTYWSAGADVTESTFQLGLANSIGSVIVAALAPVLGAIADKGGRKRRFLFTFAFLGIIMTGGLYFAEQGQWLVAIALYVFASVGFAGGNVFYDALLVSVTRLSRMDVVSALGFGLGYLGGGLLFAVNVAMVVKPEVFGLGAGDAGKATAVRVSFLMVAVWWALSSIPIWLWVPEPGGAPPAPLLASIRSGLAELAATARAARQLDNVWLFLVAYWLYIDGVDTVIRMAVDYGLSLGFETDSLMIALLITQFVGFPAAIAYGRLGERLGPKVGITIAIVVYCGVVVWGFFMSSPLDFYGLAVVVGLVQGGIQALSRSLYARLIPPDRAGEFFGFYNMLGKFAAVLGPVLMGAVAVLTGSPRVSILSILVLLVAGGLVLRSVRIEPADPVAEDARNDSRI